MKLKRWGGAGIVHSVFGVLFLPVSREQNDNRTWRGSVDRALCMNQPLQYDLVNLGNW